MGFDSEFADLVAQTLYSARIEILCVTMFFGGWLLGLVGKQKQKARFAKNGFKHCQDRKANHSRTGAAKASDRKGSHVPPIRGPIENVSPALLNDISWVIPQVAQLCNTRVPDALLLYRSALNAGLSIAEIPLEQFTQLFTALVTATARTGKVRDCLGLLSDMRKNGRVVSAGLFASAVKLCTSKQFFEECLQLFDFMKRDPSFTLSDKSIWSCLLFCAVEVKEYHRCGQFFAGVQANGTPSAKDFGNMLRTLTLQGDWKKSISLIQQMHNAGVEVDNVQLNMTLAACVSSNKIDEASSLLESMEKTTDVADVISYNTLLKGYAKAGRVGDAFALLTHMRSKNIASTQVTYGILLDCCINENQMDKALQVFSDMVAAGCQLNTIIFTTMIKGFARAGEFDKATEMYRQMKNDFGIMPDLVTFSILVKAKCDNCKLDEALALLEDMMSLGLKPDEVVFNNLIAGCARNENPKLGKKLYEDMVNSGVRPSNATFSILIRMFYQCKLLDEAVVYLREEPSKHRVEPEARLFLQLLQSCVRERQGKRAIEVYGMLAKHTTPTAAMHSTIFTTCLKLNMYDTAADVLDIAASKGSPVGLSDTRALVEAASKKGRMQVVRSALASMKRLGHPIDDKFVQYSDA